MKKLLSNFLLILLFLLIFPKVSRAQNNITSTTCPGVGCLDISVGGQGTLGIQITGTWVGTITFQSSLDASTFTTLLVTPSNSTTQVSTTTGNGVWTTPVAGIAVVRVVFTSYTSGTATVRSRTTVTSKAPGGGSGGGSGVGGSCTNQVVTANDASAVPTCTTLTSAYTNTTIPKTAVTLTSNLPLIGGGTNVVGVGTRSGSTTQFVTTTGSLTSGDCVKIDASGNFIANGSACGGGSVTLGDTQVAFGNGANTIGGSSLFTWDNTNKVLSLGASLKSSLAIGDLATSDKNQPGLAIGINESDDDPPLLVLRSTGSPGVPYILLKHSNGTLATPTQVTAGITLGGVRGYGYVDNISGGTGFTNPASVNFLVDDSFNGSTSLPGKIDFITDNSSGSAVTNLSVNSSNVTISGIKYPSVDGTANQFIKTNGSGTLSFSTILSIASIAQGDLIYGSGVNTLAPLAKSATSGAVLCNTGTSNNPAWCVPTNVSSLTGTANQVIASASTGAVTLSLPQSIATSSNVTFGQVSVGSAGAIYDTGSRYYIRSSNGYDLSLEAVSADARISTANGTLILSNAGNLTETGGSIVGRYVTAGTAPAVSNTSANSCGTTAATIVGNDNAFKVTVGATAGTSCTVTFNTAWSNAPSCSVSNETTANLSRATSTTTTVILAGTFVAGDVLAGACFGR